MGIPVAGHSDSPVSAADPLLRIQDMVTRKDSAVVRAENQRISVDEAIKVWTLDGAHATFKENTKGSITPGKLADSVVLERDPRTVPPDTIRDIVLSATYLGGQDVYTARAKVVAMVPQPALNYGDGNYGDGDEGRIRVCMFTELSRFFGWPFEFRFLSWGQDAAGAISDAMNKPYSSHAHKRRATLWLLAARRQGVPCKVAGTSQYAALTAKV
jgi:hypothetical protein